MKRIGVFCLCLAMILCGCGQAAQPADGAEAVTFTDDLGRTVTVENPQNVAALLGSFAQVWMLAGGRICAAPEDAWTDLALELSPDCVNLGHVKNLSMELLLSAQPELVLASVHSSQHLQWQTALEDMGIAVAYFSVEDFDDYLRMLQICTQITGCSDLYDTHGLQVQARIQAVLEQSKVRLEGQAAPTVLCLTASATSVRAQNSQGNVLCGMLLSLGCENIADSDRMLLENLSLEYILLADPDYIFFVQRGDDTAGMEAYVGQFLTDHPAWQQLSAVKNGRVYFMDKYLFNLKPNQRWGEAYEILEEILTNG